MSMFRFVTGKWKVEGQPIFYLGDIFLLTWNYPHKKVNLLEEYGFNPYNIGMDRKN